jgi:hypothetical protein
MTLFEWATSRWRNETPAPSPQPSIVAAPRPKPRVPAEYLSLYTYLEHRYASMVVLTFDQMESLLGFALPEPARTERDWWTDKAVPTDRHSDTWTVAHRTATPNLLARTVAFERLP